MTPYCVADPVAPCRGVGRRRARRRPRWLLAGDAAGLVDPLTREGIYYALRPGRWPRRPCWGAARSRRRRYAGRRAGRTGVGAGAVGAGQGHLLLAAGDAPLDRRPARKPARAVAWRSTSCIGTVGYYHLRRTGRGLARAGRGPAGGSAPRWPGISGLRRNARPGRRVLQSGV